MGDGMYAGDDGNVPEAIPTPTILDWLNEDCWRAVLDYVPFTDLVRSERVCRRWQGVVHHYLRDVGVCFVSKYDTYKHLNPVSLRDDATEFKTHPKNRTHVFNHGRWYISRGELLQHIVNKWGPYMVYSECPSCDEALVKTARECPNLKSLSIHVVFDELGKSGDLSQDMLEFVEKLEKIAFLRSVYSDDYDSVASNSDWRKDMFKHSTSSSEQRWSAFWRNFRPTKVKSLTIRGSYNFRYFLSAVECYPNLTELILQGEFKNANLLFGKMPKLERLYLMECWTDSEWIENIPEHVCNGLQVKQLVVWDSPIEHGWCKDLLTRCRGLQSLDIRCVNNASFLKELFRAHGATLAEIKLIKVTLSDDDLVTLIRTCPYLEYLEIRSCDGLSDAFLKKIAIEARRWRFGLDVCIRDYHEDKYYDISQASYPELLVKIEPPEYYGGRRYEVESSYPGLFVEFQNPENGYGREYRDKLIPPQYIWCPMYG